MSTTQINDLIKLFDEGDKIHRQIWHDFDGVADRCPKAVFINPRKQMDCSTKKQLLVLDAVIDSELKIVRDGVAKLNKGWKKRVVNKLMEIGGEDLAYRFVNAHPIGLGGTAPERIVKKIEETRSSLYPVSAKVYTLANIIFELIEKEYGINYKNIDFPGIKFAYNDYLFKFTFDQDNEQLLLNGHHITSFKFNTASYDGFVEGFNNSGKYVYVGEKVAHTISTQVTKFGLPKCVKRAFFVSRGEYIKFNMQLKQTDVIRFSKNADELAKLIEKFS